VRFGAGEQAVVVACTTFGRRRSSMKWIMGLIAAVWVIRLMRVVACIGRVKPRKVAWEAAYSLIVVVI
jgi:hypothetical protein